MIDIPNDIAELLKSSVKKNVRISFPNGEHEDITNTQLVSESLEFTESLCSRQELKFGLCEASSLKFECFGIPNIKGKTIDTDIEIVMEGYQYQIEPNENNEITLKIDATKEMGYEVSYYAYGGTYTYSVDYVSDDGSSGKVVSYTASPLSSQFLTITIPYSIDDGEYHLETQTVKFKKVQSVANVRLLDDYTKSKNDLTTSVTHTLEKNILTNDFSVKLNLIKVVDKKIRVRLENFPELPCSIPICIKYYANTTGYYMKTYSFSSSMGESNFIDIELDRLPVYSTMKSINDITLTVGKDTHPAVRLFLEYTTCSDYVYYPIKLGRFVVDNCKRDSTNMEKRQVEAYSEIATTNWDFPEFIKCLYNYSWRASETINFNGQNLIDLFNPNASYKRHSANNEMITSAEITTTITKTDKKGITHTFTLKYAHVPYGARYESNEIFTFKATGENYGSTYEGLYKHLNEYGITLYTYPINQNVVYSSIPYLQYNQTTYAKVCGKYDSAYNVTIPIDNEAHTILSMVKDIFVPPVTYRNNYQIRKNGSLYNFTYNVTDTNYWFRICTVVEDSWVEDGMTFTQKFKLFDKVEYFYEELGNTNPLITLTSKRFSNTNLMNPETGKSVKRNDYGFQEDLDKYFKDKNLQQYLEAYCEMQGGFGKFDRDSAFIVDYLAKADHLSPSEGLKPKHGLHPHRATFDMRVAKSMYSRCWYDDVLTKPYSRVTATFKNSEDEEETAEYIIIDTSIVDEDGNLLKDESQYQVYDISDNFYIQNNVFSQETIAPILEAIGEKIKGVRYMPFDIEMVGMPQLEAGDSVWIKTQEGCFDSYVLRRTLKGIQALKDSITSD